MAHSEIQYPIISDATRNNWRRLHTAAAGKLTSRANKLLSTKVILPVEYFSNKDNILVIQQFISFCLENTLSVENLLFSVGISLLKRAGLIKKPHVQKLVKELSASNISPIPEVENYPLPEDEFDLLGLIYQCFMLEGEKNRKGSYYTPREVAANMTANIDFSEGQKFFDPCCGSGTFMLSLEGASAEQVFACDNDPMAVMMAKINLLLKFPDEVFEPQVVCCDFLNGQLSGDWPQTFDYIVSNPPWGAVIFDKSGNPITTRESFSYFFERAFGRLEAGGTIRFLLPESVLNVKNHRNFRKFILENTDIQSITKYPGSFSGVQTKYIDIQCGRVEKSSSDGNIQLFTFDQDCPTTALSVSKQCFHLTNNLNFNLLSDEDYHRVRNILKKGKYSLKESIWALGVITGDNKNKVKTKRGRGMEPIYTGKEIEAYTLNKPSRFIRYERTEFQQVAKDEIYRADEKLVYKFISKNLVFAYDDSQSLFLNSANILIPSIPGMSIKAVLAFLNSQLFKYLYKSLFGEIKILKGNLMELPFPEISPEINENLTELVDKVLKGDKNAVKAIDDVVNTVFGNC